MTTINTFNESSLHNSLKIYYSLNNNGKMEVHEDGHIYDIVTQNGEIIEIQTKNLSKLLPKVQDILSRNKKIKIVYPVIKSCKIIMTSESGELISKRKSPKKESVYGIFKEITGLYPVLLNPNFSLEVIEVNMIDHRVRTSEEVQSKNKKRRYKRNWLKVNKRLEDIICIKTFNSKKDYLSLLPPLPAEFCAKDISQGLKENKLAPAAYCNGNLICWVLSHCGIIEKTEKKGRSIYYKIN